jgi:hypothetical protein
MNNDNIALPALMITAIIPIIALAPKLTPLTRLALIRVATPMIPRAVQINARIFPILSSIFCILSAVSADRIKHNVAIGTRIHTNVREAREAKIFGQ